VLQIVILLLIALLDATPTTQPGEVRNGMRMDEPPELRYRSYYADLARRLEPSGKGEPSRLQLYVDSFAREIVRDRRLFAFDVSEKDGKLVGFVEYEEQLESLRRVLDSLGLHVDSTRVSVGAKLDRPLGIVKAARTFLRRSTAEKSENVNEALAGEPLWLLASDNGQFLCHATDGYVGWVRAEDVELVDATRFNAAVNAKAAEHAPQIEAILAEAHSRIGKPYVWGGRSEEGVDCSGLVQQSFASQGIHLPRDAEQQALVGRLVATRWHRDALRRGDLLFFMGRRGVISHTGIYLGEGKFIESADGGVKISDFTPDSRRFESFCFAKRVLD
jgi:cell wall-associated NlpC family hydrolase